MIRSHRLRDGCVAAAASFALLLAGTAPAEEEAKSAEAKKEAEAEETEKRQVSAAPGGIPIYVPPKRARPARTTGGATRGRADRIPGLWVLVPDHVGQTVSAQPELFWFIDGTPSNDMKLQFTLMDEDAIEPNVQKVISRPTKPGVHRIRLADHGVQLEPGLEYEWSVSLLVDPKEPAKDIVATGWIDRIDESAELQSQLAGGGSAANVYAKNSLWYDALSAAHASGDGKARAALLRQVGLDEAASGL